MHLHLMTDIGTFKMLLYRTSKNTTSKFYFLFQQGLLQDIIGPMNTLYPLWSSGYQS